MPQSDLRVPTPDKFGWSIETALDHVIALQNSDRATAHELVAEKISLVLELIKANDRRYEERFRAQEEATRLQLAAAERAVALSLAAAKEAVTKAEHSTEKRFEGVNEFRAQLADQQRTLMPRAEAEIRFGSLAERVERNTTLMAEQRSTALGSRQGWLLATGVVAFVLTVLAIAGAVLTLASKLP